MECSASCGNSEIDGNWTRSEGAGGTIPTSGISLMASQNGHSESETPQKSTQSHTEEGLGDIELTEFKSREKTLPVTSDS